ncbi:hypothetical protein Tco_0261283 [Tanacetum coccineum]
MMARGAPNLAKRDLRNLQTTRAKDKYRKHERLQKSRTSWTIHHKTQNMEKFGPEFWDNSTVPYGKTWTMVNGPDQREFNLPEKIFNLELKRRT